MKKKWLLAGLMLSMIGLTGCTSAISLSEDEENMVAEYLAQVVLYDQDTYVEALVSPTPTPIPTVTPTPTQSPEVTKAPSNTSTQGSQTGTTANQQANADYVQVMGISDLKAEYTGYEVEMAYTDASFNLQASKGNELFVVKFEITNTSKKDKEFSLGDLNINYILDINTGNNIKPLITLKDNDLRYINTKIKAGKKIEGVLMFEVKKETKVNTANLIISREDKTAIVKIK
ncbi:MAG: DUF5067 domain-containing protein [Clostridiales bacterium]|nr:DUF5067 domain-containing protein [Clostridiales bacterium]